jgi:hypothetical protein
LTVTTDDTDILTDSEAEEHSRKQEQKAAATRGLTLYCLHCPEWRGTKLDEQRTHIRQVHGVARKTKNQRTCVRCEETFISASKSAKYCSPLCKKAAALAKAEAENRYALHDVPQPGTEAVA